MRLLRFALTALVAMLAASAAVPGAALAAPTWNDGVSKYSYVLNCPSVIMGSPYTELGAAAFTGFYADTNALPKTGDIFYAHVVAAGLGNPCSGTFANLEALIPSGTQLAVSADTPILCWFGQLGKAGQRDTVNCPPNAVAGTYGLSFNALRNGSRQPWPLPQGYFMEIQFPLRSLRPLKGLSANPCDCVQGAMQMIDGNSSPWLNPTAVLFVDDRPMSVEYPSDSVSAVTSTGAHTRAILHDWWHAGTAYMEIGATTAYGITSQVAIDGKSEAYTLDTDWSALAPSTTYHWRVRFTGTGGTPVVTGPDQTFATAASPAPPGGDGIPQPGDGGQTETPGGGTQTPGGQTETPGGGGQGGGTTQPLEGPAMESASMPSKARLADMVKKGLTVRIVNGYANSTDSVTLIYTAGKPRTIQEAAARTSTLGKVVKKKMPKGKVTLRVKLNSAGAKLVRKKKKIKVSVLMTVTAAGHTPASKSRTLTIVR